MAGKAGRRGDDSALLGHTARQTRITHNLTRVSEYEALARELDLTPTVLGLAWLLSRPGVAAPILGPRTLEHLTGSLPAVDVRLDAATLDRLDQLFPGPGQAPDSYTW